MSSTRLPRWVVFDFLGVIVPLGVHSGLSYLGVHTKQAVDVGMVGLMRDLQSQGVLLAVASNSGKGWIESVWEKIDNAPKLDRLITPEMGATKPNPEYFSYLLSEIRVKPAEVIFVDDRQANCEGASQAGMEVFWYQGDVKKLRKAIGLN